MPAINRGPPLTREKDMSSPIPFMVRRARLIRGETQEAFASCVGVDQATVSRWERSKGEPAPSHLAEIRKIILTAEPSYSHAYIEASPTIKYMCERENFLKPIVISKGLADAAGIDPADLLSNPESYIKEGQGIHRLNAAVQQEVGWREGTTAFFEATFFAPKLGEWIKTIGAPLAETNAALIEAAPIKEPEKEFSIKFTPFDEIRS